MATDCENHGPAAEVGVVVIGRNEGERLRRCLESVQGGADTLVYVDSGSTDGSVELAESLGALVVNLDMSVPFSAARARNEGFEALRSQSAKVRYVQFVDGDCEIDANWLATARDALAPCERRAIVAGRLRELKRAASTYHRLCDMEWHQLPGPTQGVGGIFMIRATAFEEAGGFDPSMIAGEEPEMCVRLIQLGWQLERLGAPMGLHDANMYRFGQWWKRSVRNGYAYAGGAARHGRSAQRHDVRPTRSNWVWGLLIPLFAAAAAWPTYGLSLAVLLLYPLWAWRIARGRRRDYGDKGSDALWYGLFCMIGKGPMALGQLRFLRDQCLGRRAKLIEYKGAAAPVTKPAASNATLTDT